MATAEFNLTLELDKEAVDAVHEASVRFNAATEEMQAATDNLRRAMRDLRDSLKVRRDDNGPQDPGLERRDGQA